MKKIIETKEIQIENEEEKIKELGIYFLHSLGSRERLDYGSGHELNFVMWLFCLYKINILEEDDDRTVVCGIFVKYLEVVRELQYTYWLEPAGSQGVWGLDDYQFLPFLWGSSQLCGHPYIKPRSICSKELVDSYANEYLYINCIHFIYQVKSGSFFEHSPLLYDISGVKNWEKVNEGMIKMFKSEILGKLPIMKHFIFGSFISFFKKENYIQENNHHHCQENHDHINTHERFTTEEIKKRIAEGTIKNKEDFLLSTPTCCVQRIPSIMSSKNSVLSTQSPS